MSVVWIAGRDWQPRVSEDDDASTDSFRFPPELTFNRAALNQLIEQANLLYGGIEPDIEFDGDQVTASLMALLKEFAQDRLIPGAFPTVRSEWSKSRVFEHYPFIVFPTTEQLLSEGDIFDLRRLMTTYIRTLNERFVSIAREVTIPGGVVTWDSTDFEWVLPENQDTASFLHFGYGNNIEDFLFANTANTLHTVITEAGRTVEVGVFIKQYHDFFGDYWDRIQEILPTREYDLSFEETADQFKFTFTPIDLVEGERIFIQLHYYEPILVNKELPGRVILLPDESQELIIARGQLGALRAAGYTGSSQVQNFQLDSEVPFITDFYLEGPQVTLREDGYLSTGPGTTTSPHKLVIEFDDAINEEIELALKIEGHPVGRIPALLGATLLIIDTVYTINMAGGDDNNFAETYELEINDARTQIKLKFIPMTPYVNAAVEFLRLGSGHETPVLYSIGGVTGCIGERIIEHIALDGGDGVDLLA